MSDWRDRAPRSLETDLCPRGEPVDTSVDRRWLWRLEMQLHGSSEATRVQLAADLRAYLHETCEHHWHDYPTDGPFDAHRQCLWCNTVEWTDDPAAAS